ncbi:MAG: DUF4214 domain-containing protein [Paracoccaceae bacterium]
MNFVFKENLDLWTFRNGLPTYEASPPFRIIVEEAAITLGDLSDDAPVIAQNLTQPEEVTFLAFDILQFMPSDADEPTIVAAIVSESFDRGGATFFSVRITGPDLPEPQTGEFIETAYESATDFLTFENGESVFGAPWGEGEPFDLRDVEGWEFLGQSDVNLLPGTDEERKDRVETVARLYEGALDRNGDIDEGGLNFWVDGAAQGLSDIDLAVAFTSAPEFMRNFGETGIDELEAGEYVDLLYENLLDRPADPTGRDFWISVVDTIDEDGFRPLGVSADDSLTEKRAAFLIFFSDAPESQANLGFIEDVEETLPGIWEFPV